MKKGIDLVRVPSIAFGAKYASKREVYRFLTNDCSVYLSSYETMTVWHMRDIVANKRRSIKSDNMSHIIIPQFDGLSIEDLLTYGRQYPEVIQTLPLAEKEIKKLPRQYIANVIYSIVGDPFKQWVQFRVEARNNKVAEEGEMMIEMDPDIATIFQKSNAVSGKCHILFIFLCLISCSFICLQL